MSRDLRRLCTFLAVAWPVFGAFATWMQVSLSGARLPAIEWVGIPVAWGILSLLTPGVVYVADRIRFRRGRRLQAVGAHTLTLIGFVSLHAALFVVFEVVIGIQRPPLLLFVAHFTVLARFDAVNYAVIVIATRVLGQRQTARKSEARRTRLQTRVARADFDRVRAGIDPDRVLAALADIDTRLGGNDPAAAETRIHDLCRFLRRKLEGLRQEPYVRRRVLRGAGFRYAGVTLVLVGLCFGLYAGGLLYGVRLLRGATTWQDAAGLALTWSAAGLLAALSTPLLRRCVPSGGSMANAVTKLGFVLLILIAQSLLLEGGSVILRAFGFARPPGETFSASMLLGAVFAGFVYFDVWSRRLEQSSVEAERLRGMLAEARLRSLRTQLEPHFLFNTLNSVLSQVRAHPARASEMLQKLSSLLRISAARNEHQEVTLREDLEVTSSYLDIERVRFRDALDIRIDVDDGVLDARVPAFLLQPLVENAVRHGALATIGRGSVRVGIRRERASMVIDVENDGELLDPSRWREGIGLSNLRARLQQLYGDGHELSVDARGDGVRVRISFPLTFVTGDEPGRLEGLHACPDHR